jgi:hypothetical protein
VAGSLEAVVTVDAPRGPARFTTCTRIAACRGFTTTRSPSNFARSPGASTRGRNGSMPAAIFTGSGACISLARSMFVSIVKRKAYPESHCGRRADAGSACFCSNTFAMVCRSSESDIASCCGTAATLRASARATSSGESAHAGIGLPRKRDATRRHGKKKWRQRSGHSFFLADTGLRVDDITAARNGLCMPSTG